MKYKLLGRTGLYVSQLCLGTMTFGGQGGDMWSNIGQLQIDEVSDIVKRSLDAGINFIDTADVYAFGRSEMLVGESLKKLGISRDQVVIATKASGPMSDNPNDRGQSRYHLMHSVDASLKRLQLDHIDLYQLHAFDPVTPLEESLSALNDIVRSGKVRYIGVSNIAAWHLMKALAISDKNTWPRFQSIQSYYTIAGRDLEREIVPLVKDQGVGVMVWSPLAGGILSGKYDRNGSGPEGSRRVNFDFPPVDRERAFDCIDVMREIAPRYDATVAQIALAWLLHQEAVTSVIIGAKNATQLDDNIASTKITLSSEDLARLNDVSKLPNEYPQWMIERQAEYRPAIIDI